MKYRYNDDTLLHSVGFNLWRFESVLKHGILSKNEALKDKISYSKNYFGYNKDDSISLVRYLYINPNVLYSSYDLYLRNGISFIVEGVPFIYDKGQKQIHRMDEVLVKDKIPKEAICGISVSDKYLDMTLDRLPMISFNITSYNYLKETSDNLIKYLKDNNHEVDYEEYKEIFYDLKLTSRAYASLKEKNVKEDDEDLKDVLDYYQELLQELSFYLARETFNCFSKKLGKPATLRDTMGYIMSKYGNLEIFDLPQEVVNKRR